MSITVTAIHSFTDNFIWMIHNDTHAVIVDPGDAKPVIEVLREKQLKLEAILITHHHWDHTSGIPDLLADYPTIEVYGPANETIEHVTTKVSEGQEVDITSLNLQLQVMDVPGHTGGHIAYYYPNHLFCGDTVFSGGCGRIFPDGSMEKMADSLERISQLPSETLIHCAHEYTVENLGFAQWVEPDSQAIKERLEECYKLLDNNQSTVPSTLAVELACNPFMRTHILEVKAKAEEYAGAALSSNRDTFTALRQWKDTVYD